MQKTREKVIHLFNRIRGRLPWELPVRSAGRRVVNFPDILRIMMGRCPFQKQCRDLAMFRLWQAGVSADDLALLCAVNRATVYRAISRGRRGEGA